MNETTYKKLSFYPKNLLLVDRPKITQRQVDQLCESIIVKNKLINRLTEDPKINENTKLTSLGLNKKSNLNITSASFDINNVSNSNTYNSSYYKSKTSFKNINISTKTVSKFDSTKLLENHSSTTNLNATLNKINPMHSKTLNLDQTKINDLNNINDVKVNQASFQGSLNNSGNKQEKYSSPTKSKYILRVARQLERVKTIEERDYAKQLKKIQIQERQMHQHLDRPILHQDNFILSKLRKIKSTTVNLEEIMKQAFPKVISIKMSQHAEQVNEIKMQNQKNLISSNFRKLRYHAKTLSMTDFTDCFSVLSLNGNVIKK